MSVALIGRILLSIAILCLVVLAWGSKLKAKVKWSDSAFRQKNFTISSAPAASKLLILDVRQPLDVLAYPELIPVARRILPEEVRQKPSIIPKDQDVVVKSTCPGEKDQPKVMRRALALRLKRLDF